MLDFLKRKTAAGGRTVEVGWLLDTDRAHFIWEAPRRLLREEPERRHAKALYNCPAVIDHEARLFGPRNRGSPIPKGIWRRSAASIWAKW
jgi:hypothetical protein